MFKAPEHLRNKKFSQKEDGPNGVFNMIIQYASGSSTRFFIIASEGPEWEHVSVSLDRDRCPTWEEMCKVKDLFWDEEDAVFQFHPPKSDYVNNHKFCLHLWRKVGAEADLPPSELVELKTLSQSDISLLGRFEKLYRNAQSKD